MAAERHALRGRVERALAAFGYGNGVVALAAVALVAAASRAMTLRLDPAVLLLAGAGTLAIYGLDRLRDVDRDRHTSPRRTAFVEANRTGIAWVTGLAGVAAVATGLLAGPAVTAVAGVVATFGLVHRRLKQRIFAKPVYLVLSWTAVAVAFPLARDPVGRHLPAVTVIVALSVWANVILSNLKDGEGAAAHFGATRARRVAFATCVAAAALALLGPPPVARLVALPIAMAAAVLGYRRSETYAALGIDGALAVGAGLAWLI